MIYYCYYENNFNGEDPWKSLMDVLGSVGYIFQSWSTDKITRQKLTFCPLK